jgi:hypothetical protein
MLSFEEEKNFEHLLEVWAMHGSRRTTSNLPNYSCTRLTWQKEQNYTKKQKVVVWCKEKQREQLKEA